jgi:hypothetical protein
MAYYRKPKSRILILFSFEKSRAGVRKGKGEIVQWWEQGNLQAEEFPGLCGDM